MRDLRQIRCVVYSAPRGLHLLVLSFHCRYCDRAPSTPDIVCDFPDDRVFQKHRIEVELARDVSTAHGRSIERHVVAACSTKIGRRNVRARHDVLKHHSVQIRRGIKYGDVLGIWYRHAEDRVA